MIVCEGCCKASRSVNCHRYEQNQITDLLWSFGFIFTASEVQNSEGLAEWITRTCILVIVVHVVTKLLHQQIYQATHIL